MFLRRFIVYTLITFTCAQRHEIIAGKSYYFSYKETNWQDAFLDCDNMNATLADREDATLREYLEIEMENEYWTRSNGVSGACPFVGTDESALTFGTKDCTDDMPYICVQEEERTKSDFEGYKKIGNAYYYISQQKKIWFEAYTDCLYANASLLVWNRESIPAEFLTRMEQTRNYWTSRESLSAQEKTFNMCASVQDYSTKAALSDCNAQYSYICTVNAAARLPSLYWLLRLSLVFCLGAIFVY